MRSSELSGRRTALIFIGLMASLLLYALDSTVVSTAMKAITGELNGAALYSWPFTIYLLCSTVAIPVAGGIADLRGHKPVFLAGLLLFLLGSVLCGVSRSMEELIAFRGIQGTGGGVIVSSVFTVVADLFPPSRRGKYTGLVTSMYGVASIIGPLAGGFLTDRLGWRWIFFLNLPLGAAAMCLLGLFLPAVRPERKGKMDAAGILVLAAGLVPLLLAFSMVGNSFGWVSVPFFGMISASAVMLALFVFLETKAENPVVPVSYFKDRAISFSCLMSFLNQALMFAVILYLPYFVQTVMHLTATVSGVTITPMMIGLLLASNIAGQAVSRTGKCRLLSIGSFLLTAVGMELFSTMNSATPYSLVFFASATGFAIGLNMPISNVNAQNSVPREKIGGVTSSVMFFKNLGRTVGSAVFGAVLTNSMSLGFAGLNLSHLPDHVQKLLQNPQVLTDAAAMKTVQEHVPAAYAQSFGVMVQKAQTVFASSVDGVFQVCAAVALAGAFLMIFLKEAPVRRNGR